MRPSQLGPLVFVIVIGCSGGEPTTPGAGGRVAIEVAPLSLAGVGDADYRLTVRNHSAATVWTRDVDAAGFGDGAGSIAYVGTCDAQDNDNVVTVELLALRDGSGATIPAASYRNPGEVSRTVTCQANVAVAVTFDLTLARAAQQGFFDVAIGLDDVFCSAKKLCGSPRSGDSLRAFHQPRGQHDERGDPEQA